MTVFHFAAVVGYFLFIAVLNVVLNAIVDAQELRYRMDELKK